MWPTGPRLRWQPKVAQERMENLLTSSYNDGSKVDGVLSPYDGISRGIITALQNAGYGGAEMRAMPQDGIADVIKMRHLRVIKQDAIFELARVPHHHSIPDDHVFAHVTSAPDVAVLSDPRWPF